MDDAVEEQIKRRAAYLNGFALILAGIGTLAPPMDAYLAFLKDEADATWVLAGLCLAVGGAGKLCDASYALTGS